MAHVPGFANDIFISYSHLYDRSVDVASAMLLAVLSPEFFHTDPASARSYEMAAVGDAAKEP